MAIGTVQKTKVDERSLPDKVIDKQLSRVRRHIRLTDLISGFMMLAAGLLIFLSLVVLVDHWLFGLGTAFRWLALVALILGPIWFCATRIAPAMIRGINPAYAAQTIERGEPTLKNSVLNYLLLRRDRAALHEVVYQAVQQQAAADVSHVAVEQTVDRSAVIKAGYVLVVVMGLAAAYKILSPKDPVQTVRRVIAPWADIVRPARVTIDDVLPGDAEVLHGNKLIISALIRGVKAKDEVKLLFSTEDGQLVDRALSMKLDSTGLRHTVDLTPEAEGLEQSLSYKIVAGDTATGDFHIRVVSAPTIQVDAIEYDFPAYTRRPREVVRKQGEVKALEGTRVTIRARTNQPIHTATLHLHAGKSPGNAAPTLSNVTQRIPMEFRESESWRNFFLEFADDRRTGKQSAYHLEFVNAAGQASQRPIVHRIEVVADLPPEVEILTPQTQRVEVPLSGVQPIEIRAIDPDFGLAAVRLKAISGTKEIFSQTLLGVEAEPPGQIVKTFDFRPKQWNLAVNDQISYWAEAADNRTAVNSESRAPNIARSRTFHMVIVADPPQQKPDQNNDNAGENPETPEKSAAKQDQQVPPKPGDQKRADQKKNVPTNARPQENGQQPDDTQPPQNQGNAGQEKSGKTEKSEQSNAKSGQPDSKTKKDQNKQSPTDESGGEKGESGESGSNDQSGNQTGGGNSAKPGDSKPMPGQGTGGQQPGGNTPQKSSDGSEQTTPGNQSDAAGQNRETQGDGKRSEPLHDGEVFERALNKLKGNQNSTDSNQGSPSSGDKESPSEGSEKTDKQSQKSDNQKNDSPGDDSSQTGSQRAESTDDAKSTKAKTAKSGETPPQSGTAKSDKSPTEQGNAAGKSEKNDQQGSGEKSTQPSAEKGADDKNNKSGEKSKIEKIEKGEKGEQGEIGEKAEGTAAPKQGDKQQADKKQGAGDQQKGAAGEGGKSANNTREQPEKSNQAEPKSPDDGKEPGIADNGQSGAGLNSKDKEGSASAQQAKGEDVQNSDRKKEQSADDQTPQKNEPPGVSTSKKQSDSKGGETGDRSGGGKKGSGQGAKQPGNDSAGSQSSSDDGAGKSQEAGKGETSKSAGDKQSSTDRTGNAGDKKGPGSGTTTGSDGQKANSPTDPPGEKSPTNSDQKSQANPKGGAAGGGNSGTPAGGGAPGDRQGSKAAENTEIPPGDAANLDYANRATDLVLEYLRDQQTNPDRELMDELGWTQDDLRAFLDRWRSLKEKAVEDPNAKRQLDETLRSLGIQPTKDTRRRGAQRTDENRGLSESGTDSKPPAMYQDQFRAFKKGASRGK